MQSSIHQLMLITNRNNIPLEEYLQFIETCAVAGITALQLREKNSSLALLLQFGIRLKEILTPLNIPLIINDHIDLAIALNAEGLHLGQTDLDPKIARRALGPDKIIGVSIDSITDLHAANQISIDYVGVGAIFPTSNKLNVTTLWGLEGLKTLSPLSKYPVIAIGGINDVNAKDVIEAGADGIAVIGAIHDAEDPAATIKRLRHIIDLGENSHAQ